MNWFISIVSVWHAHTRQAGGVAYLLEMSFHTCASFQALAAVIAVAERVDFFCARKIVPSKYKKSSHNEVKLVEVFSNIAILLEGSV